MRHDAVSEKDEALADQRRRHDHEKLILQDENQKLIMDIDRVSCSSRRGMAVEAAGTAGRWGEVRRTTRSRRVVWVWWAGTAKITLLLGTASSCGYT